MQLTDEKLNETQKRDTGQYLKSKTAKNEELGLAEGSH